MHIHIITLFPDVCRAYTDASVLGRAQKTEKGTGSKVRGAKLHVHYYNPRDYARDKHKRVDDRPYGGGPGMVMQAEPILRAWQAAVGRKRNQSTVLTLLMSPRGETFTQATAQTYAATYKHLVLISGRYEGIDARVHEALGATEVSVGDYVLTGGELPALTIGDAVARQLPGVLGTAESLEDARVASGEMYTRPPSLTFKKQTYTVPDVFRAGNHAAIEARRAQDGRA